MAFGALSKVRSVSMLANSTSPIAIDFGISSMKVLQIGVGEENSLIAAAAVEVPDELQTDHTKRLEFQTDALAKLLKNPQFKGRRAICAIPASQVFCKHMQFPKSDPDIAGQVQAAFPAMLGCHPDALVYRHAVVEGVTGGAGKTEVICFAVPRDLIRRIMEALRACKIEPVGIHPSAFATMRAFDSITRRDEDKDLGSLYLDLGAGATTVLIAHGKAMVFAKTIHIGGRYLDECAARQLQCGLSAARTRRREAPCFGSPTSAGRAVVEADADPSNGPGVLVAEPPKAVGAPARNQQINLTDHVEALSDEVGLCLRYHQTLFPGRRLDRLVFVGGEARNRPLCQHIARRLRLPAQIADPFARLNRNGTEVCKDVDLNQPQPAWATALGLCISPADL